MRRAITMLALFATVGVAGCAYFNALYNARRLYRDAELASEQGDVAVAQVAYRESLEKAARSLERDPDGRWADDALLLVAQNQFALGDCRASQAALQRLLRQTRDDDIGARAQAYLGASAQCLAEPQDAVAHLDAAIPRLERSSQVAAFARLWRARARFDLGMTDSAWSDLATVSARDDALARTAQLEQAARALETDRRDLAVQAFHALLANPDGDLHADSMRNLSDAASLRWGGATAREMLEPAPRAPWAGEIRDVLIVERARQAAIAGDSATALRELDAAASRSTAQAANVARIEIARMRLATAADPSELVEIRTVLLPALGEQSVRPLVNSIGVIGALLNQAQQGQPLALFAAAEVARDRLGAYPLARRLFVSYADVAGTTAWSTKALLAALALEPPADEAAALRARFARADDIYAVAARGTAPPGFEDSENRLDLALRGLVSRAGRDAQERDIAIGEAIAEIDSLTAAVRADSVALLCGSLADSLGLAGIRRDSVNAACLREDVALLDSFLVVDTLVWVDSIPTDRPTRPQDRPAAQPTAEP